MLRRRAHRPLLVAGPCLIEGMDMALRVAEILCHVADVLDLDFVWKGSFDKANRTSMSSKRGFGLDEGLRVLARVRDELGCPVLTDIHESTQAEPVAGVVDVLQIPAFLCRQTDLLEAAGRTRRPVHLKKGPFLAPWQVGPAVEKLRTAGAPLVWVGERGTTFGHGDLVVDFRSVPVVRSVADAVLLDASHAAQRPGGHGGRSAGDRAVIPTLIGAGAGAGVDGLFLEVHPDPPRALSDPDTQWPMDDLLPLLRPFVAVWEAVRSAQDRPAPRSSP